MDTIHKQTCQVGETLVTVEYLNKGTRPHGLRITSPDMTWLTCMDLLDMQKAAHWFLRHGQLGEPYTFVFRGMDAMFNIRVTPEEARRVGVMLNDYLEGFDE